MVDVEDFGVGVNRTLFGYGIAADTGIVDEHINLVGGCINLGKALGHRCGVGNIHFHQGDAVTQAQAGCFGQQLAGFFQPANRAKNVVSRLGKSQCGGAPDARIGTGNHCR